jgi:hypothetical protein
MQLAFVVTLRNITVFYLPPCNAGIIWSFKAYYRRRFNRLLI